MPVVNTCFDKMPNTSGMSLFARESKTPSSAISTREVYVILFLSNLALNTSREAAQAVSK